MHPIIVKLIFKKKKRIRGSDLERFDKYNNMADRSQVFGEIKNENFRVAQILTAAMDMFSVRIKKKLQNKLKLIS